MKDEEYIVCRKLYVRDSSFEIIAYAANSFPDKSMHYGIIASSSLVR